MDELNIRGLLSDIRNVIEFTLNRIDLDNSNLSRNITLRLIDNNVVIEIPQYAEYIDRGRRPGSPPPISAILEFIRERGIRPTNISVESLAFAIANSIRNNGITAKPFLNRLHEEIAILTAEHINIEVNRILFRTFN